MTDLLVPRGDTSTVTFVLTRIDPATGQPREEPIDAATHEFWMTVKEDTSDPDSQAMIRKRLSVPGDMTIRAAPDDHVIDVTLQAGEMALLLGDYFYDAQMKVKSTGEVRTVDLGRFQVVPDVTRAT
jgi:hypothetical protein